MVHKRSNTEGKAEDVPRPRDLWAETYMRRRYAEPSGGHTPQLP